MNTRRLIELSEKYVNNTLNEFEHNELIEFISKSEENKKLFEENLHFVKNLTNYYNITLFEQNLKKAHETFEKEKYINRIRRTKVYELFVKYGSVAAVSVIAVLITMYLFGWKTYKDQINAYHQLSNKITIISKNQKSLWNTIFSNEEITYTRGTAFAINGNGLLATSYHLVKDYDSVLVINASDTTVKIHAKVIAGDEKLDIAILKLSDSSFMNVNNVPYTINFSYPIELGANIYSLGFSKSSIVYGEGTVSSYTGFNEDTNSMQVSIPTNPGNSGSPVFNFKGEVIGIICGKIYGKEGISYAVRTIALKDILDSISKTTNIKINSKNLIKNLPKNKQIQKIIPYIFRIEIY